MKKYSFGKSLRLKKSFEFRRVREKGTLTRGRVFRLASIKNELSEHRLGLSISKSAVPKASKRIRIKRIIRELFRTNREKIKGGPYDMVVYIKGPLRDDLEFAKAKQDLVSLMEKIGEQCSNPQLLN